ARLDRYEPAMLDMLCLTGEIAWARVSTGPSQVVGATPIALFLRERAAAWGSLRSEVGRATGDGDGDETAAQPLGDAAAAIIETLRSRGAAFGAEIADACGLTDTQVRQALGELV